MEEERLKLIEQITENSQSPAQFLAWSRFTILFEKCMLLNKSKWLILEIVLIMFFSWQILINIDAKASNSSASVSSLALKPTLPSYVRSIDELICVSNYAKFNYIIESQNNKALVNEFVDYIKQKIVEKGKSITFVELASVDEFKNGKYESNSLFIFDEYFGRHNLSYTYVQSNLFVMELNEPWISFKRFMPTNDNYYYRLLEGQSFISRMFNGWNNDDVPTNDVFGYEYKNEFNYTDYNTNYFPGGNPNVKNPWVYIGYAFLATSFISLIPFLNQISNENENGCKEFLRLMGANNFLIYSSCIAFHFFKFMIVSLPVLVIMYSKDYFDTISFGLVLSILIEYFISVSIFINLLALLVKNKSLAFSIMIVASALTWLNELILSKWYLNAFVWCTPFYRFIVNVELYAETVVYQIGLNEGNPDKFGFSWIASYFMNWGIDLLSFVILLYLSECWPFQKGNIQPFYFIFDRNFWFSSKTVGSSTPAMPLQDPNMFEQIQGDPIISIRNLEKGYRSPPFYKYNKVIGNFNWDIYSNQITALLGFNGAGKTTLIDLITGMSTINSGQITVCGKSVRSETSLVRNRLGLCPQSNTFYDSLSVGQNLRIACVLNGVPMNLANKQVEMTAFLIGLNEKLNVLASKLSGGMKRRLCVGCSIVGCWDVLILDEPTSGLDPETRRDLWNLLLQLRKRRTIVLSTHFMQEADVLSDRIGIMAAGELVCAGSSSFLKKAFQTGYMLEMQLHPPIDYNHVLQSIRQYFPSATIYNQKGNELSVQLINNQSLNQNQTITNLMKHLEANQIDLGIETMTLTNTSLDNVFMKIEEKTQIALNTKDEKNGKLNGGFDDINLVEQNGNSDSFLFFERPNKLVLLWSQFVALMYKRFCYLYLNWSSTLWMYKALTLSLLLIILTGGTLVDKIIFQKFDVEVSFDISANYPNAKVILLSDERPESQNRKNSFMKIAKINYGLDSFEILDLNNGEKAQDKLQTFVANDIETNNNLQNYLFAVCFTAGGDTMVTNPLAILALPGVFNLFNENLAYSVQPTNSYKTNMRARFFSNLNADIFKVMIPILYSTMACTIVLMFIIFFLFYSKFLYNSLVAELKRKSYFLQKVATISPNTYWYSNLMFDYTLFAILVSIALVFIVATNSLHLFNIFKYSKDVLQLYFSGIPIIVFIYGIVILFKNRKDAVINSFMIFYFFSCLITIILLLSLGTLMKKSTFRELFLFNLFPPMYFILAFNRIALLTLHDFCESLELNQCNLASNFMPFDKEDDNFELKSLIVLNVIYLLLIFSNYYLEIVYDWVAAHVGFFTKKQLFCEGGMSLKTISLSEEVIEEQEEIKKIVYSKQFDDNVLIAKELRKQYEARLAVNDISFRVKKGQIYGLLGLNGAGKSTTFKMLVGAEAPNNGQIFLNGQKLKPMYWTADDYKDLGYCPQDDCLFERMSVNQHIKFFLLANGAPYAQRLAMTRRILELTDLLKFKSTAGDNLSGGNKRKLSVAISLIGAPSLILLDEPTTGVDPVSRRKLWKCLELYRRLGRCSYFLTSHSMDECELLCDQISIMVNGKIKCSGTASQLKNKYAQGYQLTLKLPYEKSHNEEYIEQVKKVLAETFPRLEFRELHMNTMDFVLSDSSHPWSVLFEKVCTIQSELGLIDFVIQPTTLEQVFLSFADE